MNLKSLLIALRSAEARSYADGKPPRPGLVLTASEANPQVKRWHRKAGRIPRDLETHAEDLRLKLNSQIDAHGLDPDERLHSMKKLGPQETEGLVVHPEHMAIGLSQAKGFADALVDHLYSGDHAHSEDGKAALRWLSRINVDMGTHGDISDGYFTHDDRYDPTKATLRLHPAVLGMGVHPDAATLLRGGPHNTSRGILAHEMAHALDSAHAAIQAGAGEHGWDVLQHYERMKWRQPVRDLEQSPVAALTLHNQLYNGAMDVGGFKHPGTRIMHPLPSAVGRLHYATSGMRSAAHPEHDDPHRMAFFGQEYLPTLTEMALNHPEALQGLHRAFPNSRHPATLVRDHWGFDFPDVEKATTDTPESAQIHGDIMESQERSPANLSAKDFYAIHHPDTIRDRHSIY